MAAARRRKPNQPEPKPEEIEELETLEPLEEEEPASPVKVVCAAAKESAFDTEIEVTVPEMDKKAMPAAVAAPLRKCIAGAVAQVRYKKVLVRFAGDTLIGSAVRDGVGEVLREAKVVLGIVRRGYGDESVATGTAPKAEFATRQDGAITVLALTSELAPEDHAALVVPELEKLAGGQKGKAVKLDLRGASLAPELRERVRAAFAGATRLALGDEVLFDKELEGLAKLARGKDTTELTIGAGDEKKQLQALEFALRGADLTGQRVRVKVAGANAGTIDKVVTLVSAAKPVAIEAGEPAEVVWPRLLEVGTAEGRTVLTVRDGGRGKPGIVAAFQREVAALGAKLQGGAITVDWPAGFDLDADTEQKCITDALGKCKPGSVLCSFAGADREPFLPPAVAIANGSGGGKRVRLDTDAGKPQELVRAIERRLRRAHKELEGKPVTVEVAGSVAPSRTLLRSLVSAVQGAKVARLELDDHGKLDVLVPALLRIEKVGAALRVAVDVAGRNAAQVEQALTRELDAAELALGEAFEVQPSAQTDAVVAALVARGAETVLLLGPEPVLVHPPLFAPATRDGKQLEIHAEAPIDAARVPAQVRRELPGLLAAQGDLSQVTVTLQWPGDTEATAEPVAGVIAALIGAGAQKVLYRAGDGAAEQVHPEIVRTYVSVLGQRDASTPPLVMFGIEAGLGSKHVDAVVAAFAQHSSLIAGRRVLLVLRDGERDRPLRGEDDVVTAVRGLVDGDAAATLVYRGLDAQRRAFFEVVHSNLETIAVGSRFADPRPRSA